MRDMSNPLNKLRVATVTSTRSEQAWWVGAGAFSENLVRIYTGEILQGLAYLHRMHHMHRDIKGPNVLMDYKGNIKLADFGASKHIQSLADGASWSGGGAHLALSLTQ